MQFISPCSSGDSRSLLVSASTVDNDALSRMAAPKSFEPCETCLAVRGTIECSVAESSAVAISCARDISTYGQQPYLGYAMYDQGRRS